MALPYSNICIWVIDLKLGQFGNHIKEGIAINGVEEHAFNSFYDMNTTRV